MTRASPFREAGEDRRLLDEQPQQPVHVQTDAPLQPAVLQRVARHEERRLGRMRAGLAILDCDAHLSLWHSEC
jgi:hypothetical protein